MSSKVKFEMEFVVKASPSLLFQYMATPSGMSEWFADNVNSRGDSYTFIWDGTEEQAELLAKKKSESSKFRWTEEEDDDAYFELRIQVDEITKDVSLIITDFADDDEVEEGKMFWENQISELKQVIGSA